MRTHPLFAAAALIAAAAAYSDVRRGRIPDALTIPLIAMCPLVRGFLGGASGLVVGVTGAALCALPPLILIRLRAIGGGDAKLCAALGALLGATLGLEAVLLAFVAVSVFALVRAAHRRELGKLLSGGAAALRVSLSRASDAKREARRWREVPFAPFVLGGVLAVWLAQALSPL